MYNRIDAALSPADVQAIHDAFETIKTKINFSKALTGKERKKGGWYLSSNALLLLSELLVQAKFQPANFPKLNVAEFERDVTLIEQLAMLEIQVRHLQYRLEDTRRLLTKDASEQGSYVYAMLKVFYDLGIDGGAIFPKLQERMPRTGKSGKPKAENP